MDRRIIPIDELREQLAAFNEARGARFGWMPPNPEYRMPLERTGVGGDMEDGDV